MNGSGELPKSQGPSDYNPHSVNSSVPASNLLDLLRGSQDNAAPKMDIRVLGSYVDFFKGCRGEFIGRMRQLMYYLFQKLLESSTASKK